MNNKIDSIELTAPHRPDDATTRILRAWLGFLDTLYVYGVNSELTINRVEVARLFALDLDSFKKMLNPAGNRTIDRYNSMDRLSYFSQAKMLPEKLLLAHETEKMYGHDFDIFDTPVVEYPTEKTTGYHSTFNAPIQEHAGYNTARDAFLRGETDIDNS